MLKKPIVLLPTCTNLHCLYNTQLSPPCSVSLPSLSNHQAFHRLERCQWRTITTTRDNTRNTDADNELWPDIPHSSIPTPYQIFQLKRNAQYTKIRYYQLVKLYHPDRSNQGHCSSHIAGLPGAVKMERYRLIVAAHEILSDPTKRKAYDTTGAGWNGRLEHDAPRHYWASRGEAKWSGFDTNDSPYRNATWEDWEKWYQRQSGKKQSPVFTSNGGFLALVISAVFLGAFAQSMRVDNHEALFKQQVYQVHDDASKQINQRKVESQGFADRTARLQNFLGSRDPIGYGVVGPGEEAYRKLLPEPEVRINDGIHQQNQNQGRKPEG